MIAALLPQLVMAMSLSCVLLTVWWLYRRQQFEQQALMLSIEQMGLELGETRSHLRALINCSKNVGDRLHDSQCSQKRLRSELDRLRNSHDNQRAVDHAMKMLREGVELTEIRKVCDLSTGEVNLLQNLSRFGTSERRH